MRKGTALENNANTTPPAGRRHARRVRAVLLALLALMAVLAGGALFLQYKLEDLRKGVQAQLNERLGVHAETGAIVVNGLRGIRIDRLHVRLDRPNTPTVDLQVPSVYLNLDFADLAYGRVTVNRVQIDGAAITLERPADGVWIPPSPVAAPAPGSEGTAGPPKLPAIPAGVSFRVTGRDCRIKIVRLSGDNNLELSHIDLDVAHLPDADDVSARIAADIEGMPEKRVHANLRFSSLEDFDARIFSGNIAADDVNRLLPPAQHFVTSGTVQPSMRASGYPNGAIVVSLDVPFENLSIRDQPAFVLPATGSLSALGQYDLKTRLLTLNTARVESNQLSGRLDGTASFADETPKLDLRLEATEVPLNDIVQMVLDRQPIPMGKASVTIANPYTMVLHIGGTTAAPEFSAEATVKGGTVEFQSSDKRLPNASLEFGLMNLTLPPGSQIPSGTLNITGGTIEHTAQNIKVSDITGALTLRDGVAGLDPLRATFAGNTITARVHYNLADSKGDFALDGIVANLEKTPAGKDIKDVRFEGDAGIRATGAFSPAGVNVDADIDATRLLFEVEWWLRKPVGIGMTGKQINISYVRGKGIKGTGVVELNGKPINLALDFGWFKDHYRLNAIRAKADEIEIESLGKCFRVPYTATGGAIRNATVDYKRELDSEDAKVVVFSLETDEISMLARGTNDAIHCEDAHIEVTMDDRDPKKPTGQIAVQTKFAHVPPFDVKWLLPLKPETPEMESLYPPGPDRAWKMHFTGDKAELAPWKGATFDVTVTEAGDVTSIDHFTAKIAEGSVEGSYKRQHADNMAELETKWTEIPAKSMLDYLKLPEVLKGTMSGAFHHVVDEDDPATLKGEGHFSVRDGQFSADVITSEVGKRLGKSSLQLPPSLKFKKFDSKVAITGDHITTTDMKLDATGMTVTGSGEFVTSGDLDYKLSVAVAPDTAEEIPMLKKYFNLEGHRLVRNDIELAFHVTGPMFNPNVELTGLPGVGPTLVSGAAAVTSETIRIIDTPRQILLDLLRIGGGLLGQTRQQRNQ